MKCLWITHIGRACRSVGNKITYSPGQPMMSKDKMLMSFSAAHFIMSSWICRSTELQKAKTRVTTAHILASLLLCGRGYVSIFLLRYKFILFKQANFSIFIKTELLKEIYTFKSSIFLCSYHASINKHPVFITVRTF